MHGVYNVRSILLLVEPAASATLLTKNFFGYDAELIDVHLYSLVFFLYIPNSFLYQNSICTFTFFRLLTAQLYLQLNSMPYLRFVMVAYIFLRLCFSGCYHKMLLVECRIAIP
jgi:hypothetical protein